MHQRKNNHKVWYSHECPTWCHPISRGNSKRFVYNTKLKVGKCFGCGWGFKSTNKLWSVTKYMSKYRRGNGVSKYRTIDSSKDDENLPF